MNCRDLLDTDPTFVAFLACWERDRRCPFPLVDYLLELGLEGQAEGARWASECQARPVFGDGRVKSGPFPFVNSERDTAFWGYGNRWSDGINSAEVCKRVDRRSGKPSGIFPSVTLAICGLLDGFADYLTENPDAIQSLRCPVPS